MVQTEKKIVDHYEDIAFDLHYPHYYGYSYVGQPVTVRYDEGRISKISPIDPELTEYVPQVVNPDIMRLKCVVVENRLRTGDFRLICYDIGIKGEIKIGLLDSLRSFNNEKFCIGEIFGFLTDTLIKSTVVKVKEWEDFEARINGIWHFGEETFLYELKERKLLDVEVDVLGVELKYNFETDLLVPHIKIARERIGGRVKTELAVKANDVLKGGVTKGSKILVDWQGKIISVLEKGEPEEFRCNCGNIITKEHRVGNYFKCDNPDCAQSFNSLMSAYMGATLDSVTFFKLLRLPNFKTDKIKTSWSISDQLELKDFESFLRYLKQGATYTKTQEKVIEVSALRLYNLINND